MRPGRQTRSRQDAAQRQIETTDAVIDKRVYEMYGLAEEEIKIAEGAGK